MTNFRSIASGIILILASVGVWQAGQPTPGVGAVASIGTAPAVPVSTHPAITVSGGDATDHRRLDEALVRFRDAGLDLPDLDVRFHEDDIECQGHYGLFQTTYSPWRVLVCTDLDFVPTHELAHAWEAAHLDDDARERYVELRGLGTWRDAHVPWVERGIEDAAFVIHKNLTTTSGNFDSSTWQERIAAYEFLTGHPSPVES